MGMREYFRRLCGMMWRFGHSTAICRLCGALDELYAFMPAESNSRTSPCDGLAHRFGNARLTEEPRTRTLRTTVSHHAFESVLHNS